MNFYKSDNYEMKTEMLESDRGEKKQTLNKNKTEDPPFAWRSKAFKEELKTNLIMAFPVLLTNVMQYFITVETMSFSGRLSSLEMEGVGLALSIITAIGWCVCSGMVTACDTMFAQAFGSKEKKRTGLFLQRGLLLFNLIPIFLIAIFCNMEPILIFLRQNADVARKTGEFLIIFAPGLMFMMNYLIFARYMQDQGCLWPPVMAGICGNIFNICAQFFFVIYLGYGLQAAALCHSFSFAVMLLCELIYIFKTRFYAVTWPGFQLEAFYDWSSLFKLGLAGVAHITFEMIIWECNVLIGGMIGPIELATQSILIHILNVLFMIYYGAATGSNIRVGQCLGANQPNRAKAAYRAGVTNIAIGVFIVVILVISLQKHIPYIFTNKQDVIDMVIDVFPTIYAILIVDPFAGICNATLRGCGRQVTGSLIIFVAFYIVGVPACLVLAFIFKFGIKGLWIGLSIGETISLLTAFLVIECQDWKKQAALAEERIIYSSVKKMNSSTNVEEQSLLQPNFSKEDILHNLERHIRTPSYPVTCSTQIVELPKPRVTVEKSIIYKKAIIALSVLLFLICGVLVHIFLPVEFYLKDTVNVSIFHN